MQHLAVAQPAARPNLAHQLPQLAARVSLGTPLIVVTTRPGPQIEALRLLWKDDSRIQIMDNVLWVQIPSDEFQTLFTTAGGFDWSEMPVDQPLLVSQHLED